MEWLFGPKKPESPVFGTINPALGVKSLEDRYNGIVQTLTKEVKEKYPEIYKGIKNNNPDLPVNTIVLMACNAIKEAVQGQVNIHTEELTKLQYDIPKIVETIKGSVCQTAGRRKTRQSRSRRSRSRRSRSRQSRQS